MCSSDLHWNKMEDIINRGGNDIYITVYNGAEDGTMLDTDVTVYSDGKTEVVPAGTKVLLKPGQSITITPYMYHDFIVPETGGAVLLGEVSMCNDDENDNRFYEPIGRFPEIEADGHGRFVAVHNGHPHIHHNCIIISNGGILKFFDTNLSVFNPIPFYFEDRKQ